MRLVFKVSGTSIVEVRQGNKYVSYSAENVALFDWIRENHDLLEFQDGIKIPVDQMVSIICDKLHVHENEVTVTNTWHHFEGDSNRFLLFGEVEFTIEGCQLNGNAIDLTDEMYEVFDDVFNSNGCFYDKSTLEKNYDGDLNVLVFWNDEATQCLGAIAESRGERKK